MSLPVFFFLSISRHCYGFRSLFYGWNFETVFKAKPVMKVPPSFFQWYMREYFGNFYVGNIFFKFAIWKFLEELKKTEIVFEVAKHCKERRDLFLFFYVERKRFHYKGIDSFRSFALLNNQNVFQYFLDF